MLNTISHKSQSPSYLFNKSYHELWCNQSSQTLHRSAPKALSHPAIENYFVVSNPDQQASPTVILPDLSPHLIIKLYQSGQVRIRIIGPITKAVFAFHRNREQTLIIRLNPTALHSLSALPLSELVDQSVLTEDILAKRISQQKIVDLIGEADIPALFSYVLDALHLEASTPTNRASRFLSILRTQTLNIHQTAQQLDVSSHYLQKISNRQFGMRPKLIAQILRFSPKTIAQLSPQEQEILDASIQYYRIHLVDKDLRSNRYQYSFKQWVVQQGPESFKQIPEPFHAHCQQLSAVSQVYRDHFWPHHRQTIQKRIQDNLALIDSTEEVVSDRLSELTRFYWQEENIRVDICYHGKSSAYNLRPRPYTTTHPTHVVMHATPVSGMLICFISLEL